MKHQKSILCFEKSWNFPLGINQRHGEELNQKFVPEKQKKNKWDLDLELSWPFSKVRLCQGWNFPCKAGNKSTSSPTWYLFNLQFPLKKFSGFTQNEDPLNPEMDRKSHLIHLMIRINPSTPYSF